MDTVPLYAYNVIESEFIYLRHKVTLVKLTVLHVYHMSNCLMHCAVVDKPKLLKFFSIKKIFRCLPANVYYMYTHSVTLNALSCIK